MCGIAGFTTRWVCAPDEREARYGARLRGMTASLRHRGPDAQRALLLDGIALGHTRLEIVDPAGGSQPMNDPHTGVTIVFNGEVFNHPELRAQLMPGYTFRTRSDTEVVLASFLAKGIDCVKEFNGQFAFAIYDPRVRTLWLARDRVGIVPLMYTETTEGLAFASEAKAIFAGQWREPAIDDTALKQTLQLWSTVTPRTLFDGISQLPPGSVACYAEGRLEIRRYWDVDLGVDPRTGLSAEAAEEELGHLLESAVRLRLRADVPVAAYLSGGIDSSVLSAISQTQLGGRLSTYSVAFADRSFDERGYQQEVARALATDHRSVTVTSREIGELLPEVVFHAEQVLVRSAPAPLFMLSGLVNEHQTRVVLTGEGADEIFLGYDLYREARIRQFWSRQPGSAYRPALLRRMYSYLPLNSQGDELLAQFFGMGLERPEAPHFSHLPRWTASGRTLRFLSADFAERTASEDPTVSLVASLPDRVSTWRPLARAQYIEMQTLLSGYLLGAQGDRMLMAHSVEGRFPFLDHRLIEFAASLPESLKLRGLKEKWILKRYAARWVPKRVLRRTKFPYRAPVASVLTGRRRPAWAEQLMSREAIRQTGIFDADKVGRLVSKLSAKNVIPSEADSQAIIAVATTQLLAEQFLTPSVVAQSDIDAVDLAAA